MELFKSRTRVAYTNAVGDKVYPVIVDIKKGIKSTEEIQFMSSDINTGILSVAFIQGNENYNVSGAEVVCSVMRPDASTLDIPCTIVENNIVEVPLGINGTSQDGIYSFDFKVFKGGNKVVGTPIMNYSVSLSISNDNAVLEDDRLPVLTMLMTQVSELKDEAREAINQANTATEATKVATANAIEATNNVNATINNANQKMLEVDNAKNEMTTTVTNKIDEVENRFNALTSKQQQDAEVIDARDGAVSLKARLDNFDSQLEHIAINVNSFNGSDNEKIQKAIDEASSRGGGTVILENSVYTVDSIIVKDNVKLQCRNTTIVASTSNKPIVVKGNNVVLDNVRVNCNSKSNLGIYVDSYLSDITIKNCEVYNVNVEDNSAYGIYISSYGSKNIIVDNCNIHDINSTPNGNVAIRDGGWSKGLVIDKPIYVDGNSSLGSKPNTANITIMNNIIENIFPSEDGDGIYVEGNDISNVINLKINNNTLKNCGKRGIKILPCSEVIITNNYIENNLNAYAFSFISFYADRVTVSNNRCIKINNYIENGIEFGYDHIMYEIDAGLNDIIISNNTLICGDIGTSYGILATHKQKIDNLSISNNIIKGSSYGVALKVLNVVSNVNISGNIMDKLRGCAVYNRACLNGCIIENNIVTGVLSTSAIDINVDSGISDKNIKNVMIHDNYINKTQYAGVSLMYGDNIRVLNNSFYCDASSMYIDTANVTNYYIQNNINLKDNTYSIYDTFKSDSNLMVINSANATLNVPKVLSKSVIVKYTVANTISNIVGEMGTILILTTSSGELTINNSSDIALKGSLNVTLAFQQSITLIRVDNRWIEISRNF